jgi:hypothetical protein
MASRAVLFALIADVTAAVSWAALGVLADDPEAPADDAAEEVAEDDAEEPPVVPADAEPAAAAGVPTAFAEVEPAAAEEGAEPPQAVSPSRATPASPVTTSCRRAVRPDVPAVVRMGLPSALAPAVRRASRPR